MIKTLPIIMLLIVGIVLAVGIAYHPPVSDQTQIKKFSSYDELKNFVKTNIGTSYGRLYGTLGAPMAAEKATEVVSTPSGDYSTTNIQVSGVDEADIVKNDGKYIYVVSTDSIVILDAYPAEQSKILSKIEFNGTPQEIFINKDKLVVFEQESYYYATTRAGIGIIAPRYSTPKTFVKVYDISDRTNPVLKRNVSIDGSYFDSRMIGDYVYAMTNQPVYGEPVPLPMIYSNNKAMEIPATEIYYFDVPDSSYNFANILAINTQNDGQELSSKTFLMGYSQNMYVSPTNIYIVYTKYFSIYDFYDRIIDHAIIPVVPQDIKNKINDIKNSDIDKYKKMDEIGKVFQNYVESLNPEEAANIVKMAEEKMVEVQAEIAKEMEKTIVHKISISNENIEYKTKGEVPGIVLNQFSMDENNGYLRIATTTGQWRTASLNHVYILDSNLKIVGKLEDLAQGERIYSVRFLGDKGYLVTFRQIDPLFVIDLSNPTSPKVLGYLKIPGVSDYLHPYDDNHVIGIGRDATEEGRIKGMKLSLFDVTDVANPKEISKYIIGESGTYSEVLNDHKAFLFSREKNLLVIPITLSEGGKWNAWQGAYVFNLDLDNGFVLKGRITHTNESGAYYDYQSQIRRSLYIDNVLYTVSNKMIKMNNLVDLNEMNKITLPFKESQITPLIESSVVPATGA